MTYIEFMIEYRVTKYDPSKRDARGAYTAGEWPAVNDIGRVFAGVPLTQDEYGRVEQPYVDSAIAFRGRRIEFTSSPVVRGLENHRRLKLEFGEGSVFPVERVGEPFEQILREELWCRLE